MTTNATLFRFGPCELDEARRSLFAHGQEIKLQPRVFDVLCYLVRHRDRVVSKDELLDALWPGTVVVDNALQRVVSLARAALAEVGLGEAVRTYPRHGYRFCPEEAGSVPAETTPLPPPSPPPPPPRSDLDTARDACEHQDWPAACTAFAAADALSPLAPADVEQWGRAAICAGWGPKAVAALERAVAQCDLRDDALGAARCTLLLVQISIDHKQGALARGLVQRTARFLEGQDASAERGHLAWMTSRLALGSGDLAEAFTHADEACRLGRSLHDADLECLGLVYRGHALMAQGEVARGLAQQEEAAALIRLGSVRPWVAGWALCSILYAARHRCDWLRAAQFSELYLEWSRQSRMPAFPGTCRLHHAAVLGVQGELERAATEVREAAALLSHAAPWAEGDAYCVLGEIQLSHGDFDGAEESFRQAHALGWDPQPGLARLHMMTGRPDQALRGLERALEETDWTLRERRGQLLCLLVHAAVGAGHAERAHEALRTLSTDAEMLATEALKAMHCRAAADVAVQDGDLKGAAQKLRQSVKHWREVGSRTGEGEARLRLAECLLADGDAAGGEFELHAVELRLADCIAGHRPRVESLRAALHEARGAPQRL